MDKRITRRILLGAVIGGLAALPFVVRALKGKNGISADIVGDFGVGDEPVDLSLIDSDLDVQQKAGVLRIFNQQRNFWLGLDSVREVAEITTYESFFSKSPRTAKGSFEYNVCKVGQVDDDNFGSKFSLRFVDNEQQDVDWTYETTGRGLFLRQCNLSIVKRSVRWRKVEGNNLWCVKIAFCRLAVL